VQLAVQLAVQPAVVKAVRFAFSLWNYKGWPQQGAGI